ncbi:MAG: phage holin family protein [Cyanobacteria bacterium]|nr:phage holin family protein [Cyanobacteriota bacterium]
MTRYLIRLVLFACAFFFLFPMVAGIQFHGTFWEALGAGVLFAFLGWVVESVAIALTAILTIGSLGMALFVLVPAWLLGFWLLPALVLRYVADIMPNTLSFTGWVPAIWGGLIMLVIGIATSGAMSGQQRKNTLTTSDR